MIETFIFTSENNNLYIYDDHQRLSLLAHPEFEKVIRKSPDADPYYLKKYAYLKAHGFFVKSKPCDFGLLKESMVRENISDVHQIVFEVTDACNLKCRYCAQGELYEGVDEKINKKTNTRYAINLLKYIFELKLKNKYSKMYVSFYGGEALLNIDFIKRIVEVANQLNVEKGIILEYSMTTNATLLHKHIDFLVANQFQLLVSLDGNEENHSYRVFKKNNTSSFQRIIENLDKIQRDHPEYFSKKLNFNAVLHDRNSVKEIYEFIYSRYHKIPRITELVTKYVKSDKKDELDRMFHSKIKSEAEYQKEKTDLLDIIHAELSLYKEVIDFLNFFSINCFISDIKALISFEEKYLPTGTCTPFFRKIFLTNRNKLLACERIDYKYSLGKVNENVEIDIPSITRQYNFYYKHIKKHCQICYAYRFCSTCLFQLNNIDTVDANEFVCDQFQDQKIFKQKLHRIFSFLEKYPKEVVKIANNITSV